RHETTGMFALLVQLGVDHIVVDACAVAHGFHYGFGGFATGDIVKMIGAVVNTGGLCANFPHMVQSCVASFDRPTQQGVSSREVFLHFSFYVRHGGVLSFLILPSVSGK